jgi:hypothetical protein
MAARRTPSVLSLSLSLSLARSAPGHGHELPWPMEFLPNSDGSPANRQPLLRPDRSGARVRPAGRGARSRLTRAQASY